MNFEEYVEKEFKNGEQKFTKIETKIDLVQKQLLDIQVTLQVDEKIRAIKARNSAILFSGITSLIVGTLIHLLKGVI